MTRRVFKYPMDDLGDIVLDLRDPIIRHVGQNPSGFHDVPCVWIERDDGEPTHRVILRFTGTGAGLPGGDFVGTAVLLVSGLVWHVYATTVPL